MNLASNHVPGSRIRRDPPLKAKPEKLIDPEERDRRAVVFGVIAFALAMLVIIIGLQVSTGFSLDRYTLEL